MFRKVWNIFWEYLENVLRVDVGRLLSPGNNVAQNTWWNQMPGPGRTKSQEEHLLDWPTTYTVHRKGISGTMNLDAPLELHRAIPMGFTCENENCTSRGILRMFGIQDFVNNDLTRMHWGQGASRGARWIRYGLD